VAAASQLEITRWQTAHHSNWAWAYRMPIKKLGPAPGIKLICGPVDTGKKIFTSIKWTFEKSYLVRRTTRIFLNIVAAPIEGLMHPTISLFETLLKL
jgi:hypothetical protein